MHKLILLSVTTTVLAAAGVAAAVEIERASEIPTDCAIWISFGSHGSGIDLSAYLLVNSYVRTSRAIASATETNWGEEGEQTLCLRIEDTDLSEQTYKELKEMLPTRPETSGGGPVGLKLWSGETYSTNDLE